MRKYKQLDSVIVSFIKNQTEISKEFFSSISKLPSFGKKPATGSEHQCQGCKIKERKSESKIRGFHRNCELCRSLLVNGFNSEEKLCLVCSKKYDLCTYCIGERW